MQKVGRKVLLPSHGSQTRIVKRILAIALCCLGAVLFWPKPQTAESKSRVQDAASSFLRRVSPGMSGQELARLDTYRMSISTTGTIWGVSTTRHSLTIQEPEMEVTLYTDGLLYGRSNGGEAMHSPVYASPFYSSKKDLALRGREVLDHLGWHTGPEVTFPALPKLDRNGKCRREILYLNFSDRPYRFPATRVGNTSLIGLDSLTGEVIELQRSVGYRYAPPELRISRDQAIKVARGSILPTGPLEVNGPAYQLLSTDEVLSPRGSALCRAKTLPLAYRLVGQNGFVVVAADAGEVLSAREQTRWDIAIPRRRTPEPFPFSIVGIGIGFASLLAFAYLRERLQGRRSAPRP
jgi:hypothetical protein